MYLTFVVIFEYLTMISICYVIPTLNFLGYVYFKLGGKKGGLCFNDLNTSKLNLSVQDIYFRVDKSLSLRDFVKFKIQTLITFFNMTKLRVFSIPFAYEEIPQNMSTLHQQISLMYKMHRFQLFKTKQHHGPYVICFLLGDLYKVMYHTSGVFSSPKRFSISSATSHDLEMKLKILVVNSKTSKTSSKDTLLYTLLTEIDSTKHTNRHLKAMSAFGACTVFSGQ
ncbi:hypothetical protein AGLY_001648 [Aphis glycines]|uniref:Uncharacterized protein n=1 Tax=Aphis glycines TaxID=307491 RepID=A0A6G0U5R0_APHGL|nr:hypothetical protein AGLY_001648 [Aphis glycines]